MNGTAGLGAVRTPGACTARCDGSRAGDVATCDGAAAFDCAVVMTYFCVDQSSALSTVSTSYWMFERRPSRDPEPGSVLDRCTSRKRSIASMPPGSEPKP